MRQTFPMSFSVAAEAYDAFMGRYSKPLAPQLAAFADVAVGQRVLDVGCGPGALTSHLVDLLGAAAVAAVDPSEPFVDAARQRLPGVQVELASAEALPFEDGAFDAAIAQLVVHFMADAVAGLREMARVTRPGGVVAACVWDHAGGKGPLGVFWDAARVLEPGVHDESDLAGAREGHLEALLEDAGLHETLGTVLSVVVEHPSFDEWWEPYMLGVGPAGAYTKSLEPGHRDRLRAVSRERFPDEPFSVTALAWAARGTA